MQFLALGCFGGALLALPTSLSAQSPIKQWVGGNSGDSFFSASNWDPLGVPQAYHVLYFMAGSEESYYATILNQQGTVTSVGISGDARLTIGVGGRLTTDSLLMTMGGLVEVQGGGILETNNNVSIGDGAVDIGVSRVTVSGAGSRWTHTGDNMLIGYSNGGELTVEDGGVISGNQIYLGAQEADVPYGGTITLRGTAAGRSELWASEIIAGTNARLELDGGILVARNDGQVLSGFGRWGTGVVVTSGEGAFFDTQEFALGEDAIFTGSGGLTKLGSGFLALYDDQTYTGATLISEGTLSLYGSVEFSTISVTADATLQFDGYEHRVGGITGAGNLVLSRQVTVGGNDSSGSFTGTVTGSGTLIKEGSGTLGWFGNSSYTGTMVIREGMVETDADHRFGSGDLVFEGGGLRFSAVFNNLRAFTLAEGGGALDTNGFDITYEHDLTGEGGLTKLGNGRLTLLGALGYDGGTTVRGGVLDLTAHHAVDMFFLAGDTGSELALGNGAVLALRGTQEGVNYAGVISGGATLVKTGDGVQGLSGNNTYSGGTRVEGGLLAIDADSRLSTGELTLDGGGIRYAAAFDDLRAFTLGANGATLDTNGFDVAYQHDLSGSGELIKTGEGRLRLLGQNSYGGGTSVKGGWLEIDGDARMGTGALLLDGGGIRYATGFHDLRAFTLGAAGGGLDTNGFDVTYGHAISGSGGLTKEGNGILTLMGENVYTGGTTVKGGVLRAGTHEAFVQNSAYTVDGGRLELSTYTAFLMSSLSGQGGEVALGGALLTVDQETDTVFSGTLAGSGSLIKEGSGSLTLNGSNNYSGGTVVKGGLIVTNADNRLGTGTLTLDGGGIRYGTAFHDLRAFVMGSNGGTLDTNGHTVSYVHDITGSGRFTKAGEGVLELTGTQTHTGGTAVTGGLLAISSDDKLGLGELTLDGGGIRFAAAFNDLRAFTLGSGGGSLDTNGFDIAYAHDISGEGGLTKMGAGTLTLLGASSHEGLTEIREGVLRAGGAGALSGESFYFLNGGDLDLNGYAATLGGLGGDSGSVLIGDVDLTVDQGADGVFAGILEGSGDLIKTGSGTLSLVGENRLTGGTTIREGLIGIDSDERLSSGPLVLDGGGIRYEAAFDDLRVFALEEGGATLDTNGFDVAYQHALTGNGSFTKSGDGLLTLMAASSYTGPTIVRGGTLRAGDSAAFQQNTDYIVNGGTLDLSTYTTFSVSSLSGSGGTVSLGDGQLIAHQEGAATFAGSLRGNLPGTEELGGASGFIKEGSGVLTFTGVDHAYNGTTVRDGKLVLDGAVITHRRSQVSVADLAGSEAGLEIINGAVINAHQSIVAGGAGSEASVLISGEGSVWNHEGVMLGTPGGWPSAVGASLTVGDEGIGRMTITDGGKLQMKSIAFGQVVEGTVYIGNRSLGQVIVRDGGVIESGKIVLGNMSTGGGILEVYGGANGQGEVRASQITGGNGGGGMVFDGGKLTVTASGTTIDQRTVVATSGGGMYVDTGNYDSAITANFSGVGGLVKMGTGLLTLSGNTGYTGITRVEAGTLRAGSDGGLARGSYQLEGGTLDLNGRALTIQALEGSEEATIGLVNADLTVDQDTNSIYAGAMTGSGDFIKEGSGMLRLTGNNTSSGETRVDGGTLLIDGSAGNVVIANGGTLGGTGAMGAMTLESGGRLAPGASLGTLTATSLSWEADGVLNFELGPDGDADLLVLSDGFTREGDGVYAFEFGGFGWEEGGIYDLITFSHTNFEVTDFSYLNGGDFSGYFTLTDEQLSFVVVTIPEPGSLALGGVALLTLAVGAMRRRRQVSRSTNRSGLCIGR